LNGFSENAREGGKTGESLTSTTFSFLGFTRTTRRSVRVIIVIFDVVVSGRLA
jgi:hypothetical protein